jgi:hypothetical protein
MGISALLIVNFVWSKREGSMEISTVERQPAFEVVLVAAVVRPCR